MTTAATPNTTGHTTEAIRFVTFERSDKTWKLGFTTPVMLNSHGSTPSQRVIMSACSTTSPRSNAASD